MITGESLTEQEMAAVQEEAQRTGESLAIVDGPGRPAGQIEQKRELEAEAEVG